MSNLKGYVSDTYVRLLDEFLAARGLDAGAILGQDAPAPGAGGGRFPIGQWKALLEKADAALKIPALGLQIGATVRPAHLGVLGYVTTHCANLGEALARLDRYQRLVYEVNPPRMELRDDVVVLEWGAGQGRPGQLVDETAIAALVTFTRALAQGESRLSLVSFINPAPADATPYEAFFGCPVQFAQATTQVVLPVEYLALPLRAPDPALRELLDQQAETLLSRLPCEDEFERALRVAMSQAITDGHAQLETVAAHLHRAPRTLQRQLAELDLGFQELLDDTRRRMAENYLRDEGLTLADIAQLLGYGEQSAFQRAFKRWTGQTPRQFRKKASS